MNVARLGNKYLADQEPWKTIKTDEQRTKTVMFVALQIASALAILSEPFLPHTSIKLQSMLNSKSHTLEWSWENLSQKKLIVSTGVIINKAELLFSKIEDKEIDFQIIKLNNSKDIQLAQRERAKEMNLDFSKLNDDQLSDDYHYLAFPKLLPKN